MKHLICLVMLLLASCSAPTTREPDSPHRREQTGDATVTVFSGGKPRTVIVHRPGYQLSSPVPLVILCHGGGSSGEGMATQTKMNAVADKHGFLVAYPNGSQATLTGGFIWNSPSCFKTSLDDVQFVCRDLPKALSGAWNADLNRVYVGGFSNGGILAWKCFSEASDVVAAFVVCSGDIGEALPAPRVPRPILYVQGDADTVCPLNGGVGKDSLTPCDHAPMSLGISSAIAWDKTGSTGVIDNFPGYVQTTYSGKSKFRTEVVLGMGHNWPGGVPIKHPPNQNPSNAFSLSEMMWAFCSPYHK